MTDEEMHNLFIENRLDYNLRKLEDFWSFLLPTFYVFWFAVAINAISLFSICKKRVL